MKGSTLTTSSILFDLFFDIFNYSWKIFVNGMRLIGS